MADPSPEAPPPPADPMAATRAGVVMLEAVADLFASFAMQANRLAGVLEASITNPDEPTLVDPYATTWPNPDVARAARAEYEAAEIERRLAEDDRTEVIRLAPTVDLRFPRP